VDSDDSDSDDDNEPPEIEGVQTIGTTEVSESDREEAVGGKAGADAVVAEMQQLEIRKVLKPTKASDLTRDQKRASLEYLMYLNQKRCDRIKGCGCADGRKQRLYKTKEETLSPTVSTEALFLTSLIDAEEERKVVTVDIPGAFMHADMDELVHMRLSRPTAELLV
jgi:hypothetical protein